MLKERGTDYSRNVRVWMVRTLITQGTTSVFTGFAFALSPPGTIPSVIGMPDPRIPGQHTYAVGYVISPDLVYQFAVSRNCDEALLPAVSDLAWALRSDEVGWNERESA